MASYELVALDEGTPQLLAPTSADTGVIVGNLQVDGSTLLGDITLNTGSITSASGTIDFGNENLTTTGSITANSVTNLVIGTDIQAWDTQLDDIAALAVTDGNIIVGDGANWVAESGATARTSLGIPKFKDDATAAPAVSNDNTEGYGVGSQWTDVTGDITYFCLDATTGAAVWQAVGSGGGSGGGDDVIGYENVVATTGGGTGDYTITTNFNMVSAGTLTVTAGDTITVPSGSTWTIV